MSSQRVRVYHNKIIRDGIIIKLRNKGIKYSTTTLSGEDKIKALEKKLLEEVNEYLETKDVDELADVLEVAYAIARERGTYEPELNNLRLDKRVNVGGFEQGIFLKETIE